MVENNELHDGDLVLDGSEDAHDQDLELETEEELTADKLKSLRTKLRSCEKEKMDTLEEMGRIRADFLNSKRRLEEQFTRDKERIIERVVGDFLPLIDSFETALSQKGTSEGGQWEKGVVAMHNQFLGILKGYNIVEIDAQGKTFNPYEHEAVTSRVGTNGEESGSIIEVLQKGYKRGDTILRPAKVIIID